MINSVVVAGRLTADPVMRTTNSGKYVTSFTVAVALAGGGNKAGFFPCVAWEETAQMIERYFSKGKFIEIQGNLQQCIYTDKCGNKRTIIEINCHCIGFGGVTKSQAEQRAESSAEDDMSFSEELPF